MTPNSIRTIQNTNVRTTTTSTIHNHSQPKHSRHNQNKKNHANNSMIKNNNRKKRWEDHSWWNKNINNQQTQKPCTKSSFGLATSKLRGFWWPNFPLCRVTGSFARTLVASHVSLGGKCCIHNLGNLCRHNSKSYNSLRIAQWVEILWNIR